MCFGQGGGPNIFSGQQAQSWASDNASPSAPSPAAGASVATMPRRPGQQTSGPQDGGGTFPPAAIARPGAATSARSTSTSSALEALASEGGPARYPGPLASQGGRPRYVHEDPIGPEGDQSRRENPGGYKSQAERMAGPTNNPAADAADRLADRAAAIAEQERERTRGRAMGSPAGSTQRAAAMRAAEERLKRLTLAGG